MKMYRVVIGGSREALEKWEAREYKHRSSANRRVNKIKEDKISGVSAIWILPITRKN